MKHIVTKEDLKAFLVKHKTLIRYTKDRSGFKNGVVVAIGPDRLGFSKVHTADEVYSKSLKSLPNFQKFCQNFTESDPPLNLLDDFHRMVGSVTSTEVGFGYYKPVFDRFTSLKLAINKAISNQPLENVPYRMQSALDDLYVRSMIYFK